MKKIFAVLLTLVMVISMFAGCDSGHDHDPTTEPTEVITGPTIDETEAPVETTVPETEAPTEAETEDPTEAPTEAPTEPEATECKHDYASEVTKAATCTTDGVKTYTCKNCKHSYTENIKAAHDYECTDTRPATCSNTGDKTYTCKNCGHSYKETLPKNEHKWGEWVVTKEPTTTSYGKKVRTCELCYGSQEVSIDPLPADETEPPATEGNDSGNNDDTEDYSCILHGHQYGDWVVTKEPTETEYGEETRTCAKCGDVITNQIDKLSDVITDCNELGLSHTMSAADAAKITRGDNYYKIVCRCGRGCVGSDRDAALAKFNAHAAEKQYDYCGEIMHESEHHYHNVPFDTVVCTVCGKTVKYNRCTMACWGTGHGECPYG